MRNQLSNELKISVDNTNVYRNLEREKFIKKIKEDPSIIENLSLERLIQLESFFEKRIAEKEKILKNLKS